MNRKLVTFLIALSFLLSATVPPAQAAGTPQPEDPPAQVQQSAGASSDFPWLGILVLGFAGVVYLVVKSKIPANTATGNCCAPVIDEAKMERERKRILEEEKSSHCSGV